MQACNKLVINVCYISFLEDGGNVWGPTWRACVERVISHKSHASNMETPMQSGLRPCILSVILYKWFGL